MKISIVMVLALVMAVMFGCQSSSPRGGSMVKGEGFRISAPRTVTRIKQGETKTVNVVMTRDSYFKQDVQMQIEPSRGINVEPTSLQIKAGDMPTMQLHVSADNDAALGRYHVSVKGTPKTGASTSTDFVVKVVAP